MGDAYDRFVARLEEVTGYPVRNGSGRCPAHDDRNPSLSVCRGNSGVATHCHAGCDVEDVVAALGLTMGDLFDAPSQRAAEARMAHRYGYRDEHGVLLFEVVRFVPKGFRQRRPDGKGGWVWNTKGVRRVLYRLPKVLEALAADQPIFVCEGEKDAVALGKAGYVATCNPGGAGKWRDEYSQVLAGADVVVVADRDQAGYRHARQVARSLEKVNATVRVVEPMEGKDAADHLTAGRTVEEFALIDAELDALCGVPTSNGQRSPRQSDSPGQADDTPRYLALTAASSIRIDRPRWVWDRRIPIGGTTLMPGREGLGKTLLVCWLAARLSRGQLDGEWLGQPADVVYVGHEDDRSTVLVPRLVAAGADLDRFYFVDIPSGGTFSLNVDLETLVAAVRDDGRNVALVVIDPLDSQLGAIDSHKKAEVQTTVGRLAIVTQQLRCGGLGLAHFSKAATTDLLTKVVGSVGFTTSVRSVLGVGEHPQDATERVCVLAKANMTDRSQVPTIRFRPEQRFIPHPDGGPDIDTARVVMRGEEHGLDPNAILMQQNPEERAALEEAAGWLEDYLKLHKVVEAAQAKDEGKVAGHANRTLQRAQGRIGAGVLPHGFPRRNYWSEPGMTPDAAETWIGEHSAQASTMTDSDDRPLPERPVAPVLERGATEASLNANGQVNGSSASCATPVAPNRLGATGKAPLRGEAAEKEESC
jgi:hypothetical protein